jgi:peroxin-5
MLIDSVQEEVNPKFKKSQFMGLMRQLRDGEVVVDGNKMVDAGEAIERVGSGMNVDVDVMGKGKGKGRAVHFMDSAAEGSDLGSQQFRHIFQQSPLQEQHQNQVQESEDPNDVYFRQENRDFAEYWTNHHSATTHVAGPSTEHRAWADMQTEWDRFEATSTGIRPVDAVDGYRFQEGNPYLVEDASDVGVYDVRLLSPHHDCRQ